MSIAAVREAMADAVTAGTDFTCHPYVLDSISSDHAYIDVAGPSEYTFDGGNLAAGLYAYTFTVRFYVGRALERAAQETADLLRDPSTSASVKQVLEDDGSALAPLVAYVRVGPGSGIGQVSPSEGNTYLFVEWPVEVVF